MRSPLFVVCLVGCGLLWAANVKAQSGDGAQEQACAARR